MLFGLFNYENFLSVFSFAGTDTRRLFYFSFGRLHMLKSLDVSFNSIMEIPEEIGSTVSLVKYVHSINSILFFVRHFDKK